MKTFKRYFLLSLLVIFASCEQTDLESEDPAGSLQNQEGYSLSIPDGFNFSTERKVRLNITDASTYVRYQVFGYSSNIGSEAENISDAFNNLLYSGSPFNGSVNFDLSLSNIYDKVYVSRSDGVESSFEITDISNNTIDISYSSVNTPSSPNNGNQRGAIAEFYYPGGLNVANIAFEDLWPSQGDYDFNDLVISYRIVYHLNVSNNIESMDYIYDVTNIGAGYNNAFGIEFPWPAELYTVTGQRDGAPQPTDTDNGSTVFFFGKANSYLNSPQTLTITFDDTSFNIPPPPYNPFLAENLFQSLSDLYEVHLSLRPYTGYDGSEQPTIVPGFAPSFAQTNDDVNGDYLVDAGVELNVPPLTDMENMPWAINIAGTYVPPLPGEFIMKGHLKFLEWAQSGGADFPDWFMDVSGYRDSNYLEEPTIIAPLPAAVGDLRSGGIVFWVDPLDNTKGLVCALTDTATKLEWGCFGNDLSIPNVTNTPPSGDGADIGWGTSNTNGIIADCSSTTNAATYARSFGPSWFLPSINELNEMWVNRDIINSTALAFGGTALRDDYYWSSTENSNNRAWRQLFPAGTQNNFFNNSEEYVRAVRAF
jgi:LruC domain-containing protein